MLQEFKKFALRGSVIDLAIGVIIGAAFGKMVSSMVDDIIMPPIGVVLSASHAQDFQDWALPINADNAEQFEQARSATKAKELGVATINYGRFVNNVLSFLIVAMCVFVVVKQANRFMPPPPPLQTRECPRCHTLRIEKGRSLSELHLRDCAGSGVACAMDDDQHHAGNEPPSEAVTSDTPPGEEPDLPGDDSAVLRSSLGEHQFALRTLLLLVTAAAVYIAVERYSGGRFALGTLIVLATVVPLLYVVAWLGRALVDADALGTLLWIGCVAGLITLGLLAVFGF